MGIAAISSSITVMPMLQPENGHFMCAHQSVAYSVRRSRRRKRTVALYVEPEGHVRILAPARTHFSFIEKMLRQRADWISRRLAEHRRREMNSARAFADGECVLYRGETHALRVVEDRARPQGCEIRNGCIEINLFDAPAEDTARREEVRLELLLWHKKQARRIFRERAEFWAHELGVKFRRLVLSNARRQWGSCSAHNDVRLNWRLILAPPDLLDYVIVHELCHVKHKNHSAQFWHMVDAAMPDWKARRRRLRALDAGLVF